jgi:splicing factor 3B subunit 1
MTTPQGTPMGAVGATPAVNMTPMTPEMANHMRWQGEMDARNRPLTDEELDAMFPKEGYKILEPPANYQPIMTPSRRLLATPTPSAGTPGFSMGATPARDSYGVVLNNLGPEGGTLPFIKEEDYQFFSKLLEEVNEDELTAEQAKERKIMKLLLKIKNGTPAQRKTAMRQITDKARLFGAGPLFNQILPLLMTPTIEDQERHLLVKVIDRVLYKLDDLVRPYVHKILIVIQPLLIDEDYYARVEGREIISNLAKAAGLASMIATMRPDIDNIDEYVRNTTARAFAVVASALGIPELLPFLKAVTQSRVSWQARHTGIKIVQHIAILMGCAILPHLKHLVDIVAHGLTDEQQKVRTITALALAAMAEAAHPYGIESFDSVLRPLWKGIRQHRGKGLAAFLKAIGFIIPLMDSVYASHYTKEVMLILIREFSSPDEEMKKVVLKVVKQCVATDGVEVAYVIDEVLPEFFRQFWVRRNALDRRNYKQLVETTVELANKVGFVPIVGRIVDDLKDEDEPYRRMVMETIDKVCQNLGAADVDPRLEEQLMDGLVTAFQEQTADDSSVMLNGFGTVVNALGQRCKPYCNQITAIIKWRLHNKEPSIRMQAADLISRVVVVMMACGQATHVHHLGQVLFEYLGEEYPDVLGSMLGALKAIVNVVGMKNMNPPIGDLLRELLPILKNRNEKVQENCIDLVGRIADRGAEFVGPSEWIRVCVDLLELLKAHKKAIRRATVNTFGYIANAIGPNDVLHTLLTNLKVRERQNRVCTTVAIAIVAETCAPFTVLPALINEYRVPELNVQNGVLKSLSFMFEYIGEMAKDYVTAVTSLLEDALMDRDLVHRQTAATTVKHLTLGVAGLNCETELVHLLNFIWPNIFEKSPHVIRAVFEAVEAMRVGLGVPVIFLYTLQGLFHPARRVREVYWKIYNNMYMYAADAMTPCYPRLEDDGVNNYRRTYMELFL